jgi:hypothetical protein
VNPGSVAYSNAAGSNGKKRAPMTAFRVAS